MKSAIRMVGDHNKGTEGFDETRERLHREMLSAVSHDLKTPLSTVIGSLEIYLRMKDRLSEEKQSQLLNSALGEAYRLDSFITNILDMARLEGGMIKPSFKTFDLTQMLEECLVRLGPLREKGTLRMQPVAADITAHTDPAMLCRAVGVLLDNALKHAGKKPLIDVEYGREGASAYIRVRDNGQGVPAGKEDEIFSKYTRFAKSDQQNAGTGLGLAICRQIMRTLSGSVTVKNHPEGGAVFTLLFPAA